MWSSDKICPIATESCRKPLTSPKLPVYFHHSKIASKTRYTSLSKELVAHWLSDIRRILFGIVKDEVVGSEYAFRNVSICRVEFREVDLETWLGVA